MKRIVLLLSFLASTSLSSLFAQSANWTDIGLTNFPLDVSPQINGFCRIAQLDFHPSNPNKFYAVTAEGGFFTSNNAGDSWTVSPATESITSACASICVDRTNDQVIYLGTGDPNYYSSGAGVYKSTDGGQTFTLTTLTNCLTIEILQHPTDASTLVAATNKGIYRTVNGGTTWTAMTATNIQFCDLQQNTAANSLILYAGTRENSPRLYRSTDFGSTWTQITSGLTAPAVDIEAGCRIAVTPADPNRVYFSNVGGYGMVFKSTDGGLNFTLQKGENAPYLTFYDNLVSSSGQGNYNNTLYVDRNNPDKIWLQSQNTWTSNDAGVTWTMLSRWSTVIHTDHHYLVQSPYDATKLYSCNDGGVWLSTDGGSSWTPKSNGLYAYEVATDAGKSSHTDPGIVTIGTQDNGRLYRGTDSWYTTIGGDDYDRRECDYLPNGGYFYDLDDLTRTALPNNGQNFFGVPTATIEAMAFNRSNTDLGFLGSAEAYRTNNLSAGTPAWTQIGSINKTIMAMHSCIADVNRLYVVTSDQKIYVSTNANGASPTFTSYNLPSASNSVASIAAIANNADIVYISINNKVYRSADGGQTWTDNTYNLPNVSHRRILAEEYGGTEELVFVATNNAVYYKKAGQVTWTNYSTNLPSRRSPKDFSMFDDGTNRARIRYASYGRAVFETGFDNLRVPKADFVADRTNNLCLTNGVVHFTDLSIGGATAWSWTFNGGTPGTSTQQNPTVTYSTAGTYDVTLTVTTPSGGYTVTKTAYITASGPAIAGGNYNVGVGGAFTTLTAAVNYWNTNCINSAVTFNLTDANYPSETFPITINANNPGSSLLIKPTGNTTITGSSATALIVINGADHVTIDGSSGSTANTICPRSTASRNLTLTNNQNASGTAMVWIQNNGSDGATYNTVKNCILVGFASNTTLFGAGSGSSTIGTSSFGAGNHYNAFINNEVRKTQYGLYSGGEKVLNKNKGTVINLNLLNAVTPNNIFRTGILVKYEDGITISGNTIGNTSLTNTGSTGSLGIACGAEPSGSYTSFSGAEVTGANITYNQIDEVVRASSSGGSATGIFLCAVTSTLSSGPNVVANNFISRIRTTNGTTGHYVSGITIGGGRNSNTKVYNNSINLSGAVSNNVQSFGIIIYSSENYPIVYLKDNLIINQLTTTNRNYAIGIGHPAPYPRLFSDYNDFYTAGANFAVVGGLGNSPTGDRNTFAAWKTETGTDANSKNVLPEFTSVSDLHLSVTGANNLANLFGFGTPLSDVTNDIDCEARNASYPTIGADENCVSPDVPTVSASSTLICGTGSTTLSIASGSLKSASDWKWYSGSCGGTLVGSGTSITVSPSTTTTYYVRGEGRCVTPGACASITITVGTAPSFTTCPGNQSTTTTTGTCGKVVTYTTAVSGLAPITLSYTFTNATMASGSGDGSGSTFNKGVTNVTITATNTCGTTTCSFTVTVTDNQAPSISCPANQSVPAAANACSATVSYSAPTGTDNCPGANTTQIGGLASGSSFPVGVTTNTFRVTDAGGLTATCAFTVTVTDNQAPSITCPANQSVNAAANTCSATVTYTAPSGTDNCSGATTVQTGGLASGASYPVGVTTNTFRVTDSGGLTSTCAFTITVVDNQVPTVQCKNAGVNLNAGGTASITTADVFLSGSDNCGTVNQVSVTPSTFGCANLGTNTVTLTVDDGHSNTGTCTATVTVSDPLNVCTMSNLPPIAICQNVTVNAGVSCNATVAASAFNNGSTDPENGSLSFSVSPVSPYSLGTTSVVLTVTDNGGLTATCAATVTVNDVTPPSVTCKNATVNLNTGGSGSITTADVYQSGSDNCGTVNQVSVTPNAFTCANIGTNTVTLTVNDGHGNTNTCTATVTVNDVTAPSVTCKNATVNLNAAGSGSITTADVYQSGSDNCGTVNQQSVSQSTFTCVNIGANTVTLTVNDGHSNTSTCTATVTVNDVTGPSVTCKNATVNLSAGGSGSITTADVYQSGSDNCGTVNQQSVNPNAFTCANIGANTVTLTVNDGHSNTGTCTATVTVNDVTAPSVTCKNATVNLSAAGNVSITTATVFQSGSDNCGTVNQQSVTPSAFTCANIGTNTVTLTVNDGHSNTATCTATVTVSDNLGPSITCKNATVNLNAAGSGSITTADVYLSGTDNCGTVNQQSVNPSVFNCANIGVNTVTLTANDGHGNTGTCTASVTVNDNLGPSVTCKAATVSLNASGTGALLPADVFQSGSDNCFTINLQSVAPSTFTCGNLGANTVTLTVNDGHGNTNTCTASVTVVDLLPPTMLCRNVTLPLDANGQAVLTVAQVNNNSYDNCTLSTMTLSKTTFTCANVGPNNVTLTGVDQSSNSGQCTSIVTVVDQLAPVAKCKDVIADLGANGQIVVLPASVNNGTTDNCGFTLTLTPNIFYCNNIGVNTVTLRATDAGGNTATCTAKVTVRDISGPTAKCANPTIFLDNTGHTTLSVTQVDNGSTDNCGIATRFISKTSFNCSEISGTNPVTLTLRDVNGNVTTCISYVTVKDAIAPTAVCEDVTTQIGPNGYAVVYGSDIADASVDNCSVTAYSPIAKYYTVAGTYNLTVTAKDFSNNASTCVSVVTVLPQFNADPNDRSLNGNISEPFIFVLYPNPADAQVMAAFEMKDAQEFHLRMFDLAGRLVLERNEQAAKGENTIAIDLSGVPGGVYIVDFETEGAKVQKRLVVQN